MYNLQQKFISLLIILILIWPLTAVFGSTFQNQPAAESQTDAAFKVLVFTKTTGFRHGSIDEGIAAVEALGTAHNFTVDKSEDASLFTDANLSQYAVVIFLNTTGDILNADQQAAFERFIQSGKGFVGIHSATDTEYGWAWYGGLVGSYFNGHPAVQEATVKIVDDTHPSTSFLSGDWIRSDEWYNFNPDPTDDVNVLLRVDESTYSGGGMGDFHPIAWYQTYDGGRSWYTGMGHTDDTYGEPLFRQHLLGGILWAANMTPDPEPTPTATPGATPEPFDCGVDPCVYLPSVVDEGR